MRLTIFILVLFLNFNSIAQQRIGMDFSSRMDNLMLTVHYQKVLKNRILYSFGAFAGGNGRTFVKNDIQNFYSGVTIASPYAEANLPVTDSSGTYSIIDYNYSAKSIGIQFGLGYFLEFGVEHGLRMNVNSTFGYVQSKLAANYGSTENFAKVLATHSLRHFIGSISLEAFHTIRLTGRLTFNYGIKVPYYFTVDEARFNPTTQKDLIYGLEPQISIGFTRVIGKCD